MKECNGHKLVEADRKTNLVGMYYCSACDIKIFIANENDVYKKTSYGGRMVYFNKNIGWEDLNINCNEMQIKKLLE